MTDEIDTHRMVLRESGCLARGCGVNVITESSMPDRVKITHIDRTGAVSRLAYEESGRLTAYVINGHQFRNWIGLFVGRCREFHEVADRMAERVS